MDIASSATGAVAGSGRSGGLIPMAPRISACNSYGKFLKLHRGGRWEAGMMARLLHFHQPLTDGVQDGLGAVVDVQLGEDVGDVILHRLLADG